MGCRPPDPPSFLGGLPPPDPLGGAAAPQTPQTRILTALTKLMSFIGCKSTVTIWPAEELKILAWIKVR